MLSLKVLTSPLKGRMLYSANFSTYEKFQYKDLQLFIDVISRDEEEAIAKFLKPILSRKRYEGNHWDDVIQQYKELELGSNYKIPDNIKTIIKKVEAKIMHSIGKSADFLSPHVIDLSAEGYIGPHIDSIKFSGGFVSGLSLQSTRIMALTYSTEDADQSSGMYGKTGKEAGQSSVKCNTGDAKGNDKTIEHNPDFGFYLDKYTVDSEGITMECRKACKGNTGGDNGSMVSTLSMSNAMIAHKGFDGSECLLPRLVELVLPPRSLYILRGPWRYNYNHAVLGMNQIPTLVAPLPDTPTHRCSIIFRDVKV